MNIYDKAKEKLQFYNDLLYNFEYIPLFEADHQISYIPVMKTGADYFALKSGFMARFIRQNKKVSEKQKIRKDSKNYFKIYKQNNIIKRVDKIINGKIDVIFIAYFDNNLRIYKPFSSSGNSYPTYSYITEFANGEVSNEYMINNLQIVLEAYEKVKENIWNYLILNYVPSGKYPVLSLEKGVFSIDQNITYTNKHSEYWYEK